MAEAARKRATRRNFGCDQTLPLCRIAAAL
jgi:hypothetical protein